MARKVYEISFNIAGRLARSFVGSFYSASSQLRRLGSDVQQLKAGIRSLEEQYKSGAIAADSYQRTHQRLTRQLERTKQVQQRLNEIQQRRDELMRRSSELRGQIVDTAAMAAPFFAAARSAMQFETAMLGVAKQVEGARDEQGRLTSVYYEMRKQIQLLGREIPIPTNEIARMVEAAARMNVPKQHLISFTKEVAQMATAFEMPADIIADQMGKIANVMQIPIQNIGDLADTINYLDDNSVAKGGDIIEVLQRIGGTAKQVNMTAHQAAALASTFLSLGKSAEVAGTASNALIRELALAKEQPERFQEALKKLGMTAEQVNAGMVKDAQGTILKILDAINKLDKKEQTAVVTGLFGKEYGDDIAALAGAISEYRRQLALLDDAQRKGSMSKEFQARLQTSEAQLQLMKNSATETAVALGNILLPRLNQVFGGISQAAQGAAEFAQKYPMVTNVIMTGLTTLIGARIAWLGLRFVWSQAAWALTGLRTIITSVTAAKTIATTRTLLLAQATRTMTVAQRLLNIAMRMSPIGMVTMLIWGMIEAGRYLYNNFDEIRKMVNGVWEAFKNAFPGAAAFIENLASKVSGLLGKLKEFWNWLRGNNWGSSGGEPISVVNAMGAKPYARGGIVTHPHLGLVGEAGPEAIIPLDGSRRAVSLWQRAGRELGVSAGDSGSVVIQLTYAPVINGVSKEEIEPILRQDRRNLMEELKAIMHQQRRVSFSG